MENAIIEYTASHDVLVWSNPDNEIVTITKGSKVEILKYASGGHDNLEAVYATTEDDQEVWMTITCFNAAFVWKYVRLPKNPE